MVEADILVSMHASDSGYTRYQGDWTGPSEMLPFRLDAFRLMTVKDRPIFDTMAAVTCHGLLTRFPDLRIALIENGGEWLPGFIEHLEDAHRKMPQLFEEDPVEAFKRNIYVSPFHEDDLGQLIELMGTDHILFGSDYPHPEGLAEPVQLRRPLAVGDARAGRGPDHGRQPRRRSCASPIPCVG